MTLSRLPATTFALTLALSLLLVGCDEAPGVSGEMQPPVVSGFQYAPDSANGASVPVADSVARIPLDVFVSASDPDGQVDRVVFLLEPATAPQATFADTLRRVDGSRYGLRLDLGLPAFVDETYTLRVFAVDDDSLASNQAIGRLRYVPPTDE